MRYLWTSVLVTTLATLSAWSAEPPAQGDDANVLIAPGAYLGRGAPEERRQDTVSHSCKHVR